MSYSRVKHSRKLRHAGCGREAIVIVSMGELQRGYNLQVYLKRSSLQNKFLFYSHRATFWAMITRSVAERLCRAGCNSPTVTSIKINWEEKTFRLISFFIYFIISSHCIRVIEHKIYKQSITIKNKYHGPPFIIFDNFFSYSNSCNYCNSNHKNNI